MKQFKPHSVPLHFGDFALDQFTYKTKTLVTHLDRDETSTGECALKSRDI